MITGIIIGLFIGAALGIFIMCLLFVASKADEEMHSGIFLETMGSFETNPFKEDNDAS